MQHYYLLNDRIEFWPDSNKLIVRTPFLQTLALNVPTSRCLQLLLEQRPQVVVQRDFYSYVWGDQGNKVTVNALYQNIALLRKHFRTLDMATEGVVVTVPRQGFQLNESLNVELVTVGEEGLIEPPTARADAFCTPALKKLERFLGENLIFVLPFLFAIALLGIIFTMGNKFGFEISPTKYKNEFSWLATRNGCHYYINKTSVPFDINAVSQNLEAQCRVKPYLYITLNEYSAASSVLACNKAITDGSSDCSIYTFIKG